MPEQTREEALAFIDAMRMTLEGKVGFRWMTEKLANLSAFIDSVTAENAAFNEFLDESGTRADFEAFSAKRSGEREE